MNNYYLFLIWGSADKNIILIKNKISKKFKIKNKISYSWDSVLFNNNLSRFYFKNKINSHLKSLETSKKKFYIFIVEDLYPKFSKKVIRNKQEEINSNVFNMKQSLRNLTNGGHKIHASNNQQEFRENMLMLNIFKKNLPKNFNLYLNPPGAICWESTKNAFNFLEQFMNYVVMRGLDNIFDNNPDDDIDLLVEDKNKAIKILNAKKINILPYKSAFLLKEKNRFIKIDIRDSSDGYYCKNWVKNIFASKKKFKGIYIPSVNNHKFMTIYHAIIHKYETPKKYKAFNNDASKKALKKFMTKQHYNFTEPHDLSVAFSIHKLKINKSISLIRRIYNLIRPLIRLLKKIFNKIFNQRYSIKIRKIYASIFQK